MLKDIIIDRLIQIGVATNNFSKTSFRWRNFYLANGSTHISDVNFRGLSDTDLVNIFERVIKSYYKQG